MITFQKYVRAKSLEEAYTLNQSKKSKILGGMLWLRLGTPNYGTVIDLSDLGLNQIEEDDTQFKIGAMVSLRELELHPGLNSFTDYALRDALQDIIGVQFRNLATAGGSIWGRFGFSDVLTVFLALDSYVELYTGGIIPLEQFAQMPYDNDILMHIIVKKTPCKCVYDSVRIQRTDFPVLTCAASLTGDVCKVVIGARPERAVVYTDKECLLAEGLTKEHVKAFAAYMQEEVPTRSNNRGSDAYRSRLVGVLTERNLLKLGGLE